MGATNLGNLKKNIQVILLVLTLLVLLYVGVINHLFKLTGTIEWNIFKSPALLELFIVATIAIIVFLLITFLKKKRNSD